MMRTFVVAVAMVPALLSCGAPSAVEPAKRSSTAPDPGRERGVELKGVDTEGLNRRIDPCTDFYEFANGNWLASNPIPASMPRWGRRAASREAVSRQVQGILEQVSARKDWPAGSVEQLVGDHYASCMDEATIDAAGLTPLGPLLAEIDGIRNRADVQRAIRRLHDVAVPVPFGTTGGMDYQEPTRFIANVVAGGLGLPGRDHYLKSEPRFVDARAKYLVHVAKVLELKGVPEAQASKAARAVFALEKRLAEASLDSAAAADPAATSHKMTFAELEKLAPSIEWAAYFDEAKLPRGDLNVSEPKFIKQVNKELKGTPVATWKMYLTWQLLDSASPWLSRPFVEESFNFKDKFLGGAAEMKPRAQRCAESTEALLGEELGVKYAERHFPPAAKAKVQEIIENLLAVLKEDVAEVQWMQPETKKKALEKLGTYKIQVGYPDKPRDHSGVTIRREAFWANVAEGRRFNVAENRRHIGKPTDPGFWQLPPSSSGAYIDLQLNSIVLPAGFLQSWSFRPEATDAVNYGAIGAGAAHDMTHAIDVGGADNDHLGRPKNWWTDADRKGFAERGQCVIEQYEGYVVEPDARHDGKLVLSEAIGDLAGVRLAYLALQKSMKSRPVPEVDGFTPEQQFFISYAHLRAEAVTPETQQKILKEDSHALPKYRVIGPLSGMPEFQQAFSCKAGTPMVRPPEKRCAVW
jgi:putative endopeptidase